MVIRSVPVDLLFAPQHMLTPGPAARGPAAGAAELLPLVAMRPYMQMAALLQQGRGDFEAYWMLQLSRRSLAAPREHCLAQWRRTARFVRWGLCRNRPRIAAIDRDRLVVAEGLEVCCLAKAAGKAWLEVELNEDLARQWDARDAGPLMEVVRATARSDFYTPVYHPDFRRISVCRGDSVRLDRIGLMLAAAPNPLRGLDIGCNMGGMTHHLRRLGLQMTGIDYDESHLGVAKALNAVYGLDVPFEHCYFKEHRSEQPYDIVLALTVLYHMLYRQEEQDIPPRGRMSRQEVAAKLDALAQHAMFWESGPQPRAEIEFVTGNTGLSRYLSLGPTQGTGKVRELGVFLRPGSAIADLLASQHRAVQEIIGN